MIFITTTKVPEDIIYKVTKAIYNKEAIDEMVNVYAGLKALRTDNPSRYVTIPLHPGAERYFREKGLKVLSPSIEDMKKM